MDGACLAAAPAPGAARAGAERLHAAAGGDVALPCPARHPAHYTTCPARPAVWDVAACPIFSPYYFATCGADRTTRLWSTDRVQPLRLFVGALGLVRQGGRQRRAGAAGPAGSRHTLRTATRCAEACPSSPLLPLQATRRTWTWCGGTPTATTWPPAPPTAQCGCGMCVPASAAACLWGTRTGCVGAGGRGRAGQGRAGSACPARADCEGSTWRPGVPFGTVLASLRRLLRSCALPIPCSPLHLCTVDQQPGVLSRRDHPGHGRRLGRPHCLGPCLVPPPGLCQPAPRAGVGAGVQPGRRQPAGLRRRRQHGASVECQASTGSGRGGCRTSRAAAWQRSSCQRERSEQRAAGGSGRQAGRQRRRRRGQRAVRPAVHVAHQADPCVWPALQHTQPTAGERRAHTAAAAAVSAEVTSRRSACM